MGKLFQRVRECLSPGELDGLKRIPSPRTPRPKSAGQIIAKMAAIDKRVRARQIDELIGICRGVLADGGLVDPEIRFLSEWLQVNLECSDIWPYDVLFDRVTSALADGVISDKEEAELLSLLHQVTGGLGKTREGAPPTGPSTEGLPYDVPAPDVLFPERSFCITGDFAFGPRQEVVGAIEVRGGRIASAPSRKTHFLVVGITASTAWKHSNQGTKIMKALELRRAGHGPAIVSEQHWTTFVRQ
ncbi:MAG: BRCT domain-containing protein [Candidatus Binatia bacterium]